MQFAYLLLAALLFSVPSHSFAQAKQKLVVNDGYCVKDGANDLACDMDTAVADGIEWKATKLGDLRAGRCFEVGGTTGTGSCICRETSTDRLFGDKDCGGPADKDAGEEYLDSVGGGTGTDFVDLTGTIADAQFPAASGAVLLYSDQDINTNFVVDLADQATSSLSINYDNDARPEFTCAPGVACTLDISEDGINEITFLPNGAAEFYKGLGVGPAGSMACVGRDSTSGLDRLFEDKDCDFFTVSTAETSPTGTTNAEGFLTEWQRRLITTDHSVSSTTATQVSGLKLDLDWIGVYTVTYTLLTQSSNTSVGTAFGVNYTGTATISCLRTYSSTGTTETTGVVDDVDNTTTGRLLEYQSTNAESTTAPNMGPTTGVAVVDSTALETIRCSVVTANAGDLELWHASSAATATTVKINSTVSAQAFP